MNNFDQSKARPKELTNNLMFLQNWYKVGLVIEHKPKLALSPNIDEPCNHYFVICWFCPKGHWKNLLTLFLLNMTCPVLANSEEANWSGSALFVIKYVNFYQKPGAGLGGSVGCAVRLETRRSRVQTPPRSVTFFQGDWSWNIFYGHSLPSADSRRAVVSFWGKNVHNTG